MRKQHTFCELARKDIAFDKIYFLISYLSISYLNLNIGFCGLFWVTKKPSGFFGYKTTSVVLGCFSVVLL